jgi:hypothetical protein
MIDKQIPLGMMKGSLGSIRSVPEYADEKWQDPFDLLTGSDEGQNI